MYNYDVVLEVVQAAMGSLTDPREDTGDPIYSNVAIGKPTKLNFWSNIGCTLLFANVTKTVQDSVNEQRRYQIIQGAVVTYVPGIEAPSILKTLHITDIVGDFFEKKTGLGIAGVTTELLPTTGQGWRPIDISKVMNLNLGQLKLTSTGTTIFEVTIPKQPELNEDGKIMNRF